MQAYWASIPSVRFGINYYLEYSPDYISENDTSEHEKLYWGISWNIVNGVYECDYYGSGYALPEPYMSKMQALAVSNNEVESLSQNIFGEEAYKLDFYVREIDDTDNITYIYQKDEKNGYYRYIQPLDEYDELAAIRPEYVKDLHTISPYVVGGTYITQYGISYEVTMNLDKEYLYPEDMHFVYDKPITNDGLRVYWQKVDFHTYDYGDDLQLTDEIYQEAKESLKLSISSPDADLTGNYYLKRYFLDFVPGKVVSENTGDVYKKFTDTYYFSLPTDQTATVTFKINVDKTIPSEDVVMIGSDDIITPIEVVEPGVWQATRDVTGELEVEFGKILSNQFLTYTYTGQYMMERLVQNVPGILPIPVSMNMYDGTMVNYLGHNIVIEENFVTSDGQDIYLTEPPCMDQTIYYTTSANGDIELASSQFAKKMAILDGVDETHYSEYVRQYTAVPKSKAEPEVIEYFESIRPVTDYLYSIYDITTFDLLHSINDYDYTFVGYSSDRTICISLSLIADNPEIDPIFHYYITQIYDPEQVGG